ncbi:MAG TPA: phospholipid carrier-dependent glycosyltransferase [Mycobacteriales bacterium]|nr:phospholipid carrier-dependent glycosyltransferase [Mycobacteriales bacterium]
MPPASATLDEPVPADELVADPALARIKARLVTAMPDDRLRSWLLTIALTVLGGIARFWRITRPGGHTLHSATSIVFDETYYVHDSWSLLHHGVETNGPMTSSGFVVHPPLGKWLMAIGEAIFDHGKTVTYHHTVYPASPLSFRFMGAVLGTLAILMVARIARRLFRSTAMGLIAGSLLALDGLEFVQSRTAMLDIYLMFWVLAAFGCLVLDRDYGRRKLASRLTAPLGYREWGPSIGFRPWRLATAFCLGAACATKWNGAYYIPAAILLALAWDIGARHSAGASGRNWHVDRTGGMRIDQVDWWLVGNGAVRVLLPLVAVMVLIPAAVYVASWAGWFASNSTYAYDHDLYVHHGQSWLAHDWAVLHGWWEYQRAIWHYDVTLHAPHPYLSRPWGWLLLERPVAYYYQSPSGCGAASCSQEVLGIGNPALWWASIPALVVVTWIWVARRDWRAAAVIVTFAFGYLPWIFQELQVVNTDPACTPAGDCHRTMFLFYMLPNVPFMVLAVTMTLGLVIGRRTASDARRALGASAATSYLACVVVLFAFFYPVLAARNISSTAWHKRIWFSSTCSTDPHRNEHHEDAPCWI